MKRAVLALILAVVCTVPIFGQSTKIQTSGTLPAHCTVGAVYLKTGTSAGLYVCLSTDTWTGPLSTGSGTVTTTGSPANGNLAKFSGASSITNGDLTGDVTTSGALATTIANDAVSYAKMQNVSAASKLLGRGDSGSGDPQEITLGSGCSITGTTLSCSGGGGGGSGSGALVLLEQHTASSSASLNFTTRNATGQSGATIQSDYDEYLIEFVNVLVSTNSSGIKLLVSTNGGSSYATTGYSSNKTFTWTAFGNGSNITTSVPIFDVSSNTASLGGYSGWMRMFDPLNSSIATQFLGEGLYEDTNVNTPTRVFQQARYSTAAAVNAFQIAPNTGTIASGTVRVYGIAKTASAGGSTGGGSLVLLDSQTASSSASIEFTAFSDAYSAYAFTFENVVAATDGANLNVTLSDGAYFSANYQYVQIYRGTTTGLGTNVSSSASTFLLWGGVDNALPIHGTGYLLDARKSSGDVGFDVLESGFDSGAQFFKQEFAGAHALTSPITSMKFAMSSGTIASGEFRLYGIAKTATATAPVGFPGLCGFRLTTETGVPVSTSDRTSQGTIYFTPTTNNHCSTYDSSAWADHSFNETSLVLSSLTSGKNYDVFLYSNAGTMTLELSAAWTNDTTRADAIAQQDGTWVKSSDHSRLYVGTIRTTGTTTTEDSKAKRFVWNRYNQRLRQLFVTDATTSWAYTTSSYRQANGSSSNQVEVVTGLAESLVSLRVDEAAYGSVSNQHPRVGVGVNSTTTNSAQVVVANGTDSTTKFTLSAAYADYARLGYSAFAWLEYGTSSITAFYGGAGTDGVNAGMLGTMFN